MLARIEDDKKLKPLGPYFVGQLVEYVGTPSTTARRYQLSRRRWHVVQTAPSQEGRVEAGLEELQFGTYVPRVLEKRRLAHERYCTIEKPMLVGYVLAGFDPDCDEWQGISSLRGVLRLFKINERPVPIAEREMQRIRDAEARDRSYDDAPRSRVMMLKVHDCVQIKDWPFMGFFGTVTGIDARHWKVKVEMNIFGRTTPIELGCDHVDLIG